MWDFYRKGEDWRRILQTGSLDILWRLRLFVLIVGGLVHSDGYS